MSRAAARWVGLSTLNVSSVNIARSREPLAVPTPTPEPVEAEEPLAQLPPCPAAAGACPSSRPSNAGCSRARRPALPQQPGRRREPTCFIPTRCRRAVASAIGTLRAHRLARVVRRADPCRDRRNGQPIVSDFSRLCLETLSRYASGEAQRTLRPPTPAQAKHQIPIRRALHSAGSFLGDFPTPNGVRNSSREQTFRLLPRQNQGPAAAKVSDGLSRDLQTYLLASGRDAGGTDANAVAFRLAMTLFCPEGGLGLRFAPAYYEESPA